LQIAIEIEIEILRVILRERELNLMINFVGAGENFPGMGAFCFGCVGCMQRGF
jgi:hypothetical protein